LRRRRIESPWSLTRESMTCVSGELQNGHFMPKSKVESRKSEGKREAPALSPFAFRLSP
jgi:hypothetical protein